MSDVDLVSARQGVRAAVLRAVLAEEECGGRITANESADLDHAHELLDKALAEYVAAATPPSDSVVAYLLAQREAASTDDGGLLRRDWWQFWDDQLTQYRAQRAEMGGTVSGGSLRSAAIQMRKRAKAAREDQATYGEYWDGTDSAAYYDGVLNGLGGASGEHAAAWAPDVADRVADLLDNLAAHVVAGATIAPSIHSAAEALAREFEAVVTAKVDAR